jgi:inward rectifier potassium channel
MAMFKHARQKGKEFGFGNNTIGKDQRILNKDGSFNVNRKGLSLMERFSFFHWMINTRWSTFFLIVVGCFFLSSAFFAFIYDAVLGASHFHGIESNTRLGNYWELFFFSAQTSTTVGYGRINPATNIASFIAVLDALSGVLYFAIVTGLLYGRFSKPIPKIIFSEKGVVAPYKDGFAIMFRLANKLNHQLQNAEVRLIASLIVDVEGLPIRQYFELELERKEIIFLASSWTIVHAIDEKSPFFQMTREEFDHSEPEFMMQLKVYDNSYSQDTFTNTSYRKEEIIWNAKFEKILLSENSINYVDFNKFNEIIQLP